MENLKPTESINDAITHLHKMSPEMRQEVFHYLDFLRERLARQVKLAAQTKDEAAPKPDASRHSASVTKKTSVAKRKVPLEDFEDLISMKM